MKREDAICINDAYAKSCIFFGMDLGSPIDCPINEIYDDFESRVCKNCIFWVDDLSNMKMCNRSDGIACKVYTKKDDGCNKFEPKK